MREYSFIKREEEHSFQFSSKSKALKIAKQQTRETGRNHQIFLTTTYRNLVPRICWTTCLALH